MNIQLLIIDPQNDFCDPNGSLFVGGADQDAQRLAAMIQRISPKLDDIHVTLDSHRLVDIAHPIFWVNSNGENPAPFTIITVDDVKNGAWKTKNPAWMKKFPGKDFGALDYVERLEQGGRYPLCIWPPHCLIATWGHSIVPAVSDALIEWERSRFGLVDYVTKGSNPFTEHYSGVQADVPDSSDPTTMLNTELCDTVAEADLIALTGEALSHCLANTARDIAKSFGEQNINKFVLIEDLSSNVTTFEKFGEDFVKEYVGKGMQVSNSVDFLS